MRTRARTSTRRGEAGFTLVEALVAIIVLVFGLMAVTNLMVVAASSNSVANQSTAAVTSATRGLDVIKATSFANLPPGTLAWETDPGGGLDCDDPNLPLTDYHCTETVPGVGMVHTHWTINTTTDPRIFHIRVRSEGLGVLSGARSRAEFTTFRACTNTAGGCPEAP